MKQVGKDKAIQGFCAADGVVDVASWGGFGGRNFGMRLISSTVNIMDIMAIFRVNMGRALWSLLDIVFGVS